MNRKWIGVVVAIVLAAVGTWVIVQYVQGADDRALEGEETVSVLVVATPVPAGTPSEDVAGSVIVELVPVKVQADGSLGSVDDLADLDGLVTAVDLVPGEQVIEARFITPQTLEELDDIVVPDGLLEITLSLSPERAVGGVLRPGDEVAVFASFEPFTINTTVPGEEQDQATGGEVSTPDTEFGEGVDVSTPGSTSSAAAKTPSTSSIILHNVLVTTVHVASLNQEETSENSDDTSLELLPSSIFLVTLAMEPEDAERFVFTAEFGTVWLADESETVDASETSIQDRSTVYGVPEAGGQ
jgi:pilus assembly protein CpaB